MTICGNVTAEPELRFTQSGVAVANFTVAATPRRYDQESGEWVDGTTTFMRVDAWRELGEHCTETLDKGSRVVVTGTLVTETWEKEDGEKRSRVKIVADDVGTSLLFATATIRKVRRDGAPPPTDPRTGEQATARTRSFADDEPPF